MAWNFAGETVTLFDARISRCSCKPTLRPHACGIASPPRAVWLQDAASGRVDGWWTVNEQIVTAAPPATLVGRDTAITRFGLIRGMSSSTMCSWPANDGWPRRRGLV